MKIKVDYAEAYYHKARALIAQGKTKKAISVLSKAFRVDPELETIVWDNGADLAPEFLHSRLLVTAQSGKQGKHP